MPESPETFWNGEPARARRCRVVVREWREGDPPRAWWRPYVGMVREAVEVGYEGVTFYLDDEGFPVSGAERRALAAQARELADSTHGRLSLEDALSRVGGDRERVGSPGWGWRKVTLGFGGPGFGHADVAVDRVVDYMDGCSGCGAGKGEPHEPGCRVAAERWAPSGRFEG